MFAIAACHELVELAMAGASVESNAACRLDVAVSREDSKATPCCTRAKLNESVSVDVAVPRSALEAYVRPTRSNMLEVALARSVFTSVRVAYSERSTGLPNAVVVASWSHAVMHEPPRQRLSVAVVEAF